MANKQNHFDAELSKFPATKAGAKLLNLQYYYTGKPCRYGHYGLRYASSGNCLDCFESIKNKTSPVLGQNRSHSNSLLALTALENGETTYRPETPCVKGHYLRYVGSNNCVDCNNEAEKKRSEAGYHRWARIKTEYGLTREEFYKLRASQSEKCAICETSISDEKKTHIDHDHLTGAIRGLLCGPCNQGLGLFKDSPQLLQVAINYLKAHNDDPKRLPD